MRRSASILPAPLVAAAAIALLPCSVSAQSVEELAPKTPVPPSDQAGAVVPIPPPAPSPGNPSDRLLARLDGLVFVPGPDKVRPGGAPGKDVVLDGVTVPDETAFRGLVQPYLDHPLTRGDLDRLKAAIAGYYRDHDLPVVDVLVPPQDITNGVLQIVLLEGRVGQVKVAGNEWFSADSYRDALRLEPGDPIRVSGLQADLDWINQNPFREASAVFSPGVATGETDITVQAKDRFPLRVYAGADDDGPLIVGEHQYFTGFNYGNVTGIGDQLNYQFTTSGDAQSLLSHSVSYVLPLPWRDTFTLSGNYVTTRGDVPPVTTLTGESWQVSARYALHLAKLGDLKHEVTAGYDLKYLRNALQFGGVPVSNAPINVNQFELGYDGVAPDRFGQTTFNLQLYDSPGGLVGDNSNADFAAQRPFSRSQYAYGNLALERLTKLPEDYSLVLRGTFQYASANLPISEELGFGGYNSVRGYDPYEVLADSGYILTTELRTPAMSLAKMVGASAVNDQLQLLAFWDYGGAYVSHPLAGAPRALYLSAVGAGLRYAISTYLTARFDYGVQLHRLGLDSEHGSRADFSVIFSY